MPYHHRGLPRRTRYAPRATRLLLYSFTEYSLSSSMEFVPGRGDGTGTSRDDLEHAGQIAKLIQQHCTKPEHQSLAAVCKRATKDLDPRRVTDTKPRKGQTTPIRRNWGAALRLDRAYYAVSVRSIFFPIDRSNLLSLFSIVALVGSKG